MQEGVKVRKHFKQLELYMSHWLNLMYLENMIMSVDETDALAFTVFSKEVNHKILLRATEKVRKAFQDVPTHSDFLGDILKHVETSIPNISFDIKTVELARAYRQKVRARTSQPRKRSTDLSNSFSSHLEQNKSSSRVMMSPSVGEFARPELALRSENSALKKEDIIDREPFKQIISPFCSRIDDIGNRDSGKKPEFKRRAGAYKGVNKSREINENTVKDLKLLNSTGEGKEIRAINKENETLGEVKTIKMH